MVETRKRNVRPREETIRKGAAKLEPSSVVASATQPSNLDGADIWRPGDDDSEEEYSEGDQGNVHEEPSMQQVVPHAGTQGSLLTGRSSVTSTTGVPSVGMQPARPSGEVASKRNTAGTAQQTLAGGIHALEIRPLLWDRLATFFDKPEQEALESWMGGVVDDGRLVRLEATTLYSIWEDLRKECDGKRMAMTKKGIALESMQRPQSSDFAARLAGIRAVTEGD